MGGRAREQVRNLLGPDDIHRIIDARSDHGCDDHSKVSSRLEQVNGQKRISLVDVGVVYDKNNERDSSNHLDPC